MNSLDWLNKNCCGFSELSRDELKAILHFTILWSLFELKLTVDEETLVRRPSVNVDMLKKFANRWAEKFPPGNLLQPQLTYFQNRFFCSAGRPTAHFHGLNFRQDSCKEFVEDVFTGKKDRDADKFAALLMVVHRFRNNLFHGEKTSYKIKRQLENFTRANEVLMNAIETHRHLKSMR